MCLRLQAHVEIESAEEQKARKAVRRWIEGNCQALQMAAYEALLPSRGHLKKHICDTHGMLYQIEEAKGDVPGFTLVSAQVKTLNHFWEVVKEKLGPEEAKKIADEHEARLEKQRNEEVQKTIGMFFLVQCGNQYTPVMVSVEERRIPSRQFKDYYEDWEAWLKREVDCEREMARKKVPAYMLPPGAFEIEWPVSKL